MSHSQYVPICLPRGAGKTFMARAWARETVLGGARSLLIADRYDPCQLAGSMVGDAAFRGIRMVRVMPQRDEFCPTIRGRRWDAAIVENIDEWPLVKEDPSRDDSPLISVLLENILAYTHGPILVTFSRLAGLAQQMFGLKAVA